MPEPVLSISALSRQLHVTPRAIRYYESLGLLRPARKGTKRIYHDRDRQRLAHIIRLQRLGLPLSLLQESMGGDVAGAGHGDLAQALRQAAHLKALALQRQSDIDAALSDIRALEKKLASARPAPPARTPRHTGSRRNDLAAARPHG